jgi:2-C-methyl-D-erythritol 2,4-cyclodiphosphate synthase
MNAMKVKTGLGQDSHRFDFEDNTKQLILGGVTFDGEPPLKGNSDADVVLHAITNAISGITGVNILGARSDSLCLEKGIINSAVYLQESLNYLESWTICHLSCSIECLRPKISPKIEDMKKNISALLSLTPQDIGITATTGEGLTAFGRGEGIQVLCIITAVKM